MAAILKMVKSPYLSEKSSDFDETWYITSDIEPQNLNFKIVFLAITHQPIVRFQRNFV